MATAKKTTTTKKTTTKKAPAKKAAPKKTVTVKKSALSEQDKNTIWLLLTVIVALLALLGFYYLA